MSSHGWLTTTVGDLAQVRGGKRLPTGYFVQSEPTPHPYIRVTDMRDGGIDDSNIRYVPLAAAAAIRAYRIRSSEIFISVAGTLGIVGRIPAHLDGANLTENADRITNISSDVEYLAQYLRSEPIQNEIDSIRTVGAQPKLALGRIKKFEVQMPEDRGEQERVAEALTDADRLITKLRQLVAKKRDIKQGMMQELLTGKTRLPGFAGAWKSIVAGDAGSFKGGSGFPNRFQGKTSGAYPFIKVSDMNLPGNEVSITVANHYVTESVRALLGATAFPVGSIVFAKVGAAVYLERKRRLEAPTCIDNNMAAFIPDRQVIDPGFARHVFNAFPLSSLVAVGALPSLNGAQLRSIPIETPSDISEQHAIADVLDDCDAEIAALERRIRSTRAIKQGMMQELLTGRTRLVAEGVAA